MNEIWKPVNGYETLYEVSDLGNVRNARRKKLLSPYTGNSGYKRVKLYRYGIRERFLVHRLVAQVFIPNPQNLPQVNHKDENKTNNRADNLEWCDNKYNMNYGTRTKRASETKSLTVYMYNEGGLCGLWPSASECHRITGYNRGKIGLCCLGKHKKYKGFKWSYEPPKPLLALPYYPHCTSVQVFGRALITAE